jgi:hypothetical protein
MAKLDEAVATAIEPSATAIQQLRGIIELQPR